MMPWDCQQRWFWVAATCLVSGVSVFIQNDPPVANEKGRETESRADVVRRPQTQRKPVDEFVPVGQVRLTDTVAAKTSVLPDMAGRSVEQSEGERVGSRGIVAEPEQLEVASPSFHETDRRQPQFKETPQSDRDQTVRRLMAVEPGHGRNYEPAFARTGWTIRTRTAVPDSVWLTGGIEPEPIGE